MLRFDASRAASSSSLVMQIVSWRTCDPVFIWSRQYSVLPFSLTILYPAILASWTVLGAAAVAGTAFGAAVAAATGAAATGAATGAAATGAATGAACSGWEAQPAARTNARPINGIRICEPPKNERE